MIRRGTPHDLGHLHILMHPCAMSTLTSTPRPRQMPDIEVTFHSNLAGGLMSCLWVEHPKPSPSHHDKYWLVVWNINFIFPYIGLQIIPIDFHIFQRGGPGPPTRIGGVNHSQMAGLWHCFTHMIHQLFAPIDVVRQALSALPLSTVFLSSSNNI